MTISVLGSRNEYTSTASQTVFSYTFRIYTADDLNVYATLAGQDCVPGDLTTAYVVDPGTIGDPAGGFITFDTPRGVGDLININSSITQDRTTDYQVNGDFRPVTVNADFDRTVSMVKDIQTEIDRMIVSPECRQGSTQLEVPEYDAGKAWAWDEAERKIVNSTETIENILDTVAASEAAAAASKAAAASSEGNAASSEANSATSETNAQKWAENPEDLEVTPGNYSALHHASKASSSALSASTASARANQWANNAEDLPVTTGPDAFSALHWSQKAMAAAAGGQLADNVWTGTNEYTQQPTHGGDVLATEAYVDLRGGLSLDNTWTGANEYNQQPTYGGDVLATENFVKTRGNAITEQWDWADTLSADPGTGNIAGNAVLLEDNTEIRASVTTSGGATIPPLVALQPNDLIYVVSDDNIYSAVYEIVTSPVDNGTYSTTAVIYLRGAGGDPTAGDPFSIAWVPQEAPPHTHVEFNVMPEVEYRANQAANINEFAGSGFVEYGKHKETFGSVNEGVTAYGSVIADSMEIGYEAIPDGTSKTLNAVMNINGAISDLLYINTNQKSASVNFPPPPNGSETYDSSTGVYTQHADSATAFAAETATTKVILSRKDFWFIEYWEESVAKLGHVWPNGCVQSDLSTYKGVSATFASGDVPPGYKAFGDGNVPSLQWSFDWRAMSDADKQLWLADPADNLFLGEDGDLKQGRVRIRVVKGFGDDWTIQGVNVTNPMLPNIIDGLFPAFGSSTPNTVHPRGQHVSIISDLDNNGSSEGAFTNKPIRQAGNTNPAIVKESGMWVAVDNAGGNWTGEEDFGYKGNCFAIPGGLVSRLNTGIYHPQRNEHGTAYVLEVDGSSGINLWHSSLVKNPLSTEDCFLLDEAANNTVGNVAPFGSSQTGFISSGFSGSHDGKFYDAIYKSQCQDLRLSARKQELGRTLTRENQKSIAGALEHYQVEGIPFTVVKERGVVETLSTQVSATRTCDASNYANGDFVIFIDQNGVLNAAGYTYSVGGVVLVTASTLANSYAGVAAPTQRTTGDVYTILKVEYSTHEGQELTWTDIIGDPANYSRQATGVIDFVMNLDTGIVPADAGQTMEHTGENVLGITGNIYRVVQDLANVDFSTTGLTDTDFFTDLGPKAQFLANAKGIAGFPLLYNDAGGSLIPDGVSKAFKASRKVIGAINTTYSDDQGVGWTVFTGWNATLEGATNATVASPEPVGRVHLLTYTTPAHIYDDADNAEVLALGDVYSSNVIDGDASGKYLVSDMINKVATATGLTKTEQTPVTKYKIDLRANGLYGGVPIEHNTLNPVPGSPASKRLAYLGAENGQLYLYQIFKEMIHDASMSNSIGDFQNADGTVAQVYVAGTHYRITGLDFAYAVLCKATTGSVTFSVFTQSTEGFVDNTGLLTFQYWNNSGWGDDNKFSVINGIGTATDDNGNLILIGQKRTPLPYILREDD